MLTMRKFEELANQSYALRMAAKNHRAANNNWLADAMEFSAKYFAEENKKVSRELDRLLDLSETEHEYMYQSECSDGYMYDLADEDFSSYREEWFEYNSQYGDYLW